MIIHIVVFISVKMCDYNYKKNIYTNPSLSFFTKDNHQGFHWKQSRQSIAYDLALQPLHVKSASIPMMYAANTIYFILLKFRNKCPQLVQTVDARGSSISSIKVPLKSSVQNSIHHHSSWVANYSPVKTLPKAIFICLSAGACVCLG